MPICGGCKKEFETEFKKNGQPYKRCQRCRNHGKCEHGIRRIYCKECGGTELCEHGKIRYTCVECHGNGICEHDRRRYLCKECHGDGICEHGHRKYDCVECKGSGICEHGIQKYRCVDCEGTGVCEHGKQRYTCVECQGTGICKHKRIKAQCVECHGTKICKHDMRREYCVQCHGSQICEHDKRRDQCFDCDGSMLCEHGIPKWRCVPCEGSQICEHKKDRRRCIKCNPKSACQLCFMVGHLLNEYKPYCFRCYCYLNPDFEPPRRFMIKEHFFRQQYVRCLDPIVTEEEIIFNKQVGESMKRPDSLIQIRDYSIIVELDEEQHDSYDCENKRMMEIFKDLGNKPMVMIRFNPDSYLDSEGNLVKGCFNPTKSGYDIDYDEWEHRFEVVFNLVEHYILYPPTKEIHYHELFYDCKQPKEQV